MNKIFNFLYWRFHSFFRGLMTIISDFIQNSIGGSYLMPLFLRRYVYLICGNKIGKKVRIHSRCFLGPGAGKLSVGGATFINYNCWFDLGDDIFIGSNCNIAMNVHFINGSHLIGTKERRAGEGTTKPIRVGNGAWIGADCVIMPGVEIGAGCIIGAGSLVLHDTDDNSIYVGRPAKKIKNIIDEEYNGLAKEDKKSLHKNV